MSGDNDGWENYSRLVLQQLEGLAKSINQLREEFQTVNSQLSELKAKEDRVQEIRAWKGRIDEVVSATQLKQALGDVEDLKIFKTKAITAFIVVQFFMGFSVWISKFIEF
tara:strand:- start:73 stop:402 length:330 start_codon:yes stop_codon:yes gene_type:complete